MRTHRDTLVWLGFGSNDARTSNSCRALLIWHAWWVVVFQEVFQGVYYAGRGQHLLYFQNINNLKQETSETASTPPGQNIRISSQKYSIFRQMEKMNLETNWSTLPIGDKEMVRLLWRSLVEL